MTERFTIPLSVLLARETIEQPWREVRWRSVEVLLGPAAASSFREVARGPSFVRYVTAPIDLVLDRHDEMAYRANLANGEPSVYVVLNEHVGDGPPVRIELVTLSPFAARASQGLGPETVDRVAMPGQLRSLVQRFLGDPAEHRVEPAMR